jgi:hypothetical protein
MFSPIESSQKPGSSRSEGGAILRLMSGKKIVDFFFMDLDTFYKYSIFNYV